LHADFTRDTSGNDLLWTMRTLLLLSSVSARLLLAATISLVAQANTPPVVSAIPDQITDEDVPILNIPFTVGDAETPADQLRLSTSFNDDQGAKVFGKDGVVAFGSGPNRLLSLYPLPDQYGTNSITVTVTDAGGLSASAVLQVSVLSVNDPPRLSAIPRRTVILGTPTLTVPFTVSDPDIPRTTISLRAFSSRPSVVPNSALLLVPPHFPRGHALDISLRPDGNPGSTAIRIEASDGLATSSVSFILDVVPAEFVARPSGGLPPPATFKPAWGDFDGDGDLDLLLSSASVHTNDGTGLFRAGPRLAPGTVFSRSAVADYNGDGFLDVLFPSGAGTRLLRYEPRQNGFVTEAIDQSRLPSIYDALWADLDSDGDLDVLYSGLKAGWLRNEGGGAFTPLTGGLPGGNGLKLSAADFDGDGAVDVLVLDTLAGLEGYVRLFVNDGTGSFRDSRTALPQQRSYAAGWGDVDGDGQLDLWLVQAVAQSSRTNTLLVLRQESGRFVETFRLPNEALGTSTNPPAWSDFDNDGDIDFAGPPTVAPPAGGVLPPNIGTLYRNDGQGRFTTTDQPLAVRVRRLDSQAADFDGDGVADLLDRTELVWQPLRNQSRAVNSLPDAPGGLHAVVAGELLALFWGRAEDANQTAPLTYNVRVGTAPGLNDVVPSMSTTHGVRMIPALGNAGFNTWLTLNLASRQLDTDALYWSVQAVDNSYQGGPFAPEQTVLLNTPSNQPPSISGVADVAFAEDTTGTTEFQVTDDRTPLTELKLQTTSSNPALLPPGSVRLSDFTSTDLGLRVRVTVTPTPNGFGEATTTITATDRGGSSSARTFHVTVAPVNDPPSITVTDVLFATAGAPSPPIFVALADVETPTDQLMLQARSLSPAFVADANLSLISVAGGQNLVVTPATGEPGMANIELTVTDADGAQAKSEVICRFQPVLFTAYASEKAGFSWPPAFLWADLNADRKPELVVGAYGNLNFTVRAVNPGRLPLLTHSPDAERSWMPLDVGDFDNDGDLDILSAGPGFLLFPIVIYRNRGNLTFEPMTEAPPYGTSARFGDVNLDGRQDVIVADQAGNLKVYWNTAQGLQAGPSSNPLRNSKELSLVRDLIVADIDGDGLPDVVLIRDTSAQPEQVFFRWDGQTFVEQTPPWSEALLHGVADFDQDQRPDLLTDSPVGWKTVWNNLGNGAFKLASGEYPTQYGGAVITDFDGDGLPDFLSYGRDSIRMYLGVIKLGFVPSEIPFPTVEVRNAASADFDGDGVQDLAASVTAEAQYTLSVYRGSSVHTNNPPTAPAALRACATSSNVVALSWNLASDPNQSGGLTYNVRVGTAPGRGDVVSPEALPDGYRLVPRHGNAGWLTHSVVTGLEPGRTYYWSVQAVDNSFVGGPFAAEASFTMPTVASGELGLSAALALRHVGGGRHELELCATPNTRWQLEVSTDLITWQDFTATPSALQADTNGVARLGLDLVSDRQFFRVRRMQP